MKKWKLLTGSQLERLMLLLVLLTVALCLLKYAVREDMYTFHTECDDSISMTDMTLMQEIILEDNTKWNADSYAVFFGAESNASGSIQVTVQQNGATVQTGQISVKEIHGANFVSLHLDTDCLRSGTAMVLLEGDASVEGCKVFVSKQRFDLPELIVNGVPSGTTLYQRYTYAVKQPWTAWQMPVFLGFLVLNAAAVILLLRFPESKRMEIAMRCFLTADYLMIVFLFDNTLLFHPIWAEQVTNFLHNGYAHSFLENLTIADAGYLPLNQRLIALLFIKLLRLPPLASLLMMQLAAYVITGLMLSYFIKLQYRRYLPMPHRYLLCMVYMLLIVSMGTGAFINYIVYGMSVILLYFLADSTEFSRFEYGMVCAFGALCCLSKGSFVTLLPFFALYLLLFYRSINKRDRLFLAICSGAAAVQLLFYVIKLKSEHLNWLNISGDDSKSEHDLLSILVETVFDTAAVLFRSVLGDNVDFSFVSLLLVIALYAALFVWLGKRIVRPLFHKETVRKRDRLIFLLVGYIAIQCLFFNITVSTVRELHPFSISICSFDQFQFTERYYIFVLPAAVMLIMLAVILGNRYSKGKFAAFTPLLLIAVMFLNQNFSPLEPAEPSLFGRLAVYSQTSLLREIDTQEHLCVPIIPAPMTYQKNCKLYYIGSDTADFDLFCDGDLTDAQSADRIGAEIAAGHISLDDSLCLYQLFLKRYCQIGAKPYQAVFYDRNGNVLCTCSQENPSDELLVAFRMPQGVSNAAEIVITDDDGQCTNLCGGIYLVTSADSAVSAGHHEKDEEDTV